MVKWKKGPNVKITQWQNDKDNETIKPQNDKNSEKQNSKKAKKAEMAQITKMIKMTKWHNNKMVKLQIGQIIQ
jgi:hypothetical protein